MSSAAVTLAAALIVAVPVPGSRMVIVESSVTVTVLVMIFSMILAVVEALVVGLVMRPFRLAVHLAVLTVVAMMLPDLIVRRRHAGGPREGRKGEAHQQRLSHRCLQPDERQRPTSPLKSLPLKISPGR